MKYDQTFYEKLLRHCVRDATLKIRAIHEKPATATGENFFSDLLRVTVEFSRDSPLEDEETGIYETRRFILKRAPGGGGGRQLLSDQQELFPTELRVLRDILPRIEKALKAQLGPRFVHFDETSPCTIVMEDLEPRGFLLKDRQEGFSMAHANLAMKNLAKFHAGSVAIYEEKPDALRNFKMGMFNEFTPRQMYKLLAGSLIRLSDTVKTWRGREYRLASEKLRVLSESVETKMRSVFDHEPGEFCVLNHGDAWINNILFTENSFGDPCEQIFVDFQMAVFSSPAIDLLYFLYINPSVEIRGEAEPILLKSYLETLKISMKKLGCKTKPPTLDELERSMYKRRAYAAMAGLFLLPRMLLDKEDIEDMDQLLKDGVSKGNETVGNRKQPTSDEGSSRRSEEHDGSREQFRRQKATSEDPKLSARTCPVRLDRLENKTEQSTAISS